MRDANALPSASVLIGTRNRVEPVAKCLQSVFSQTFKDIEVLVLDDASDMDIASELGHRFDGYPIRWMRSQEPSGVAGARNKLIKAANSPILIFMDDDAYFEDDSCIERAVNYLDADSQTGIVAFRITLRGEDEGELQVPFTRRSRRAKPSVVEECNKVSYFVGAAHAIRKDVFLRCGLYQDDLVYGHEELDLSYSAIQEGFQIVYATDIPVSHAPQSSVISRRKPSNTELFYNSRNRMWVAYKHLPLPYLPIYMAGWILFYGLRSLRDRSLIPYIKGLASGIRGMPRQSRQPLDSDAIGYLKSNHGRLWY